MRNCRIVSVYSDEAAEGDIAIRAGRIAAIRPAFSGEAKRQINAGGLYVFPGLVASRVPGGAIAAGDSREALRAGVTSLVHDITSGGRADRPDGLSQRFWAGRRIGVPGTLSKAPVASASLAEAVDQARCGLFTFPHLVAPGSIGALLLPWIQKGLDLRMVCLGRSEGPATGLGEGPAGLREAIGIGIAPERACGLASLNPALAFGVDAWVGSVTPGRWADFWLSGDLGHPKAERVFLGGTEVG